MDSSVKNLIYEREILSIGETIINISLISVNYDFENYYLETTNRRYSLKINKKSVDQCSVINRMYNDIKFNPLTSREIYYSDPEILLMEYFQAESSDMRFLNQHIFGESIAKFHTKRESYYGYGYDTYIGSLLQENKMSQSWKKFYLNQRFDCLLGKMKETLSINPELNDKILIVRDYIDRNLSEPSKSTLIHGDIWSGNILVDNDRNLKIIDPALFYADNEYELAYIYLNGTFSRGFYDGYNHNNPICNEESAYPANPDSEYGWEKLFSERLYLTYNRNWDMKNKVARYHNIFGPLGAWNNGKEKSPAALCRKVAEAKNGGSIEIWGDGEQTRSFLYIDECLEGTTKLIRSESEGH